MRSFLRTIIVICWWYRWKLEMLKGLLFWCVIFFSSGLANWGWKHLNPPIIKKRWEKIGMKLLVTMMVLNMPWVTHSWDWMSLSKSTSSKYQSSHPQNSSELEFENSSQHLRIRTKINKHIKQTSLMSSALFWTSIYIYILILCHVRYGIWTFTDQRGVLGCSKKVGLIFEENPTTWQRYHLLRTRAPGKLKDYLWCLAFWYLLFISRDTTTRTTTTIHFQVSVTLFFFLWTLLDTSTKSQVTCASTSCCIFSCISVSSYGGDYDDFFSSIWFRWLLHLRVEMGHICMYNISILHVTKNEKTQDTKHESNVSYLPYNMALPNAARNTKYQRLNRLG